MLTFLAASAIMTLWIVYKNYCSRCPADARSDDEESVAHSFTDSSSDLDDIHIETGGEKRALVMLTDRRHMPRALAIGAAFAMGSNAASEGKKHVVTLSVPPPSCWKDDECRIMFHTSDDKSPRFKFTASGDGRSRLGVLVRGIRKRWKKNKYARESPLANVAALLRGSIQPTLGDLNSDPEEADDSEEVIVSDEGSDGSESDSDMVVSDASEDDNGLRPSRLTECKLSDMPTEIRDFSRCCSFHEEDVRFAHDAAHEWTGRIDPELLMNSLVGPGIGACERWSKYIKESGGDLVQRSEAGVGGVIEFLRAYNTSDRDTKIIHVGEGHDDWHALVNGVDKYLVIGDTQFVDGCNHVDVKWEASNTNPKLRGIGLWYHMPLGQVMRGCAIKLTGHERPGAVQQCISKFCTACGVAENKGRVVTMPRPTSA